MIYLPSCKFLMLADKKAGAEAEAGAGAGAGQ